MAFVALTEGQNGYLSFIPLTLAAIALLWALDLRLEPDEPQMVRPRIPLVGHLIGMMRYHMGYFEKLCFQNPTLPILTIPVITQKTYIISSPELYASAVRSKSLSFEVFATNFGDRLIGPSSNPDQAKTFNNFPEDPKEDSFMRGFHKGIHENLIPGPKLQLMNATVLKSIGGMVNQIQDEYEQSMWKWLRDGFTLASTNALFGEYNPIAKDNSLVEDFWEFDNNILYLLLAPFPQLMAPKTFKARKNIQSALSAYFIAGHHFSPTSSSVTLARANNIVKWGFSTEDIGKFEIASIHVALSNAFPTMFWLLYFTSTDPAVIASLREELINVTSITDSNPGIRAGNKKEATIDITAIAETCPLLMSAYNETMRLTNAQSGVRFVTADTKISDGKDSYLLKKGSMVHLPSGALHKSTVIWGPDAMTFNARRFLKPVEANGNGMLSEQAKEMERQQKKAFVPFGGGKHLCPGRHFAFAEILGTVAVLTLGYDITTKDGGVLPKPTAEEYSGLYFAEAVVKPRVGSRVFGMGARMKRRKGWEDVAWKFKVGDY